ncbi:hypothetical protein KGP26_07620 [Serratia sp. JSRIV002]|uniref:hypothetical protein n=1 Tax=Serratia sp. JSRIV002 TaxID=2831894 RepID=UPI001CC08287|nr:hypothetical protein [Serratia sp. JSRIV002]UAN52920.1 hypothetical protein KGP26_07620 [Serratia sp. JSRIV002]
MANSFDFEIHANDQVSAAIQRIDDVVTRLNPLLETTTDNLRLGGQESLDGLDSLSDRLSKISTFARDNVQFIGDMVPPLKMVGELGGKLGGALKFGAAGAAAYGVGKSIAYMAGSLQDASHSAYELDVAAKNAGMRVDDFTRLSGAMQILGVDAASANQSVEGLYATFNDALQGRNNETLAVLTQIGVQIVRNKDGTADVLKTMERLAQVIPKLSPEKQKTVADAIGLDAAGLALLREGLRLKALLAKSDKFGLTVDPQLNSELTALDRTINELGVSYEGLKQRTKNNIFSWLLSDGSVKDGLKGITDVFSNGLDSISLGHAIGLNRGNEADQLRWGYNNPKFYETLGELDKVGLDYGYMTDGYREKYQAWQKPNEAVNQLQLDLAAASAPVAAPTGSAYAQPGNNALGLRNNNPGNLRAAPNATGMNGGFSTFATPQDGLSALSRQLQLYGDRGNNTLNGILHTYAPRSENKTQLYIDAVAKQTGFGPGDRLNLHSPEVLEKIIPAIIKHENGTQPFSRDDILQGINESVTDDRWRGLRDRNNLLDQRQSGLFDPVEKQDSAVPLAKQQESTGAGTSLFAPQEQSGEDIARISDAMSKAIEENKFQLEVTLINSQTGERRKVDATGGGRVSFSMQSPV